MSNNGSGSKVILLNRVLRIVHSENRQSFEVEGDPRHAEIIVSELGHAREWTVDTLDYREGLESCSGNRLLVSPFLSGEETKQYRSLTMRASYWPRTKLILETVLRT